MRLLRWLTERPLNQAEANAALRALMAKRVRNHPDYVPRYRPEWAKADDRFAAKTQETA